MRLGFMLKFQWNRLDEWNWFVKVPFVTLTSLNISFWNNVLKILLSFEKP